VFNTIKSLPNFNGSNYTAIGLMLAGLAAQISGLDHWADALHPAFIGGAVAIIASVLQGIGSQKPQQANGGQ